MYQESEHILSEYQSHGEDTPKARTQEKPLQQVRIDRWVHYGAMVPNISKSCVPIARSDFFREGQSWPTDLTGASTLLALSTLAFYI